MDSKDKPTVGKVVCVTSEGNDLEANVDPRFGRCQYFIIVDTSTLDFEAVRNPNISGMGGVGVQSAQLMVDKNVNAVLTGNVGPNAFQTLKAAGIEMITGVTGVVKDVVEKYKEGGFKSVSEPTVEHKSGLG